MENILGLEKPDVAKSVQRLFQLLADTYGLYLKTQSYHWNVVGENFYPLHLLFEKQYEALSEAVDILAERIRTLDHPAPGSFSDFQDLTQLIDKALPLSAAQMLSHLLVDHQAVIQSLREGIEALKMGRDEGTTDLFIQRLQAHEKMAWMLKSSLAKV